MRAVGMFGALRRRLGAVKRRVLGERRVLPRSHYQEVWDAQARTEAAAKVAVAGYEDEARLRRTAEQTLKFLQDSVGVRESDVVLEIGAGVGRVGRVLAPLCREWVGADVSAHMLRHLRQRLADLPNVRTVLLNGYDLGPIATASADLVYCTVVFMHLDEWERYNYVREAFRVLRPGGRLFADNFNLLSDEGWAMFEEVRKIPPRRRPAHASKSSTPQELEVYFRRAGFEQIGQATDGLWVMTWGRKPGAAGS
ncbi:MAG TPA: class I SAM-dependent methyltransferase [Gemmataceae bacterium]